jgi:hypothetical protein
MFRNAALAVSNPARTNANGGQQAAAVLSFIV